MSDKQNFFVPKVEQCSSNDKQHIKLTYIIHYYFDQESESTLLNLLDKYSEYSSDLLDVVQFVIIDDGSPLKFDIPNYEMNIIWLRILDDIPWNQGGARNLGAVYAKSDNILLSDLDHEFPEHTLQKMISMKMLGRKFYKIWKFHPERNEFGRPHPNTFLISRARFLRLYGYDEEYSGGYGAEDYRFVKFQKYHGSWQRHLNKKFYCLIRKDIDRKKSYHSLDRSFERNSAIDQRKRNELLYWGEESGHSREFLNFKWDIVSINRRQPPSEKIVNRVWKHLWWFRTLKALVCN